MSWHDEKVEKYKTDTDMTKSLKLSDKEHKINLIKMIRTLSKKVDNLRE